MRENIFHPAVVLALFCPIIVLTMFGIAPVLAAVSLAGAFLFSALGIGLRASLAKLRWQLPLLAIICLANPLFSAMGSTLLARVGPWRVYAESLAFGATMGALLVSVLMWIEALAHELGADEFLALAGARLPRASLAVSMVSRLVPELMRRADEVRRVSIVSDPKAGSGARAGAKVMGSLVTWSLEDSIERADSMRARGWGADVRRSSYSPYRFRARDALGLAVCAALAFAAAAGVAAVLSGWSFYPRLSGTAPWIAVLPFALLCLAPSAARLFEARLWGRMP